MITRDCARGQNAFDRASDGGPDACRSIYRGAATISDSLITGSRGRANRLAVQQIAPVIVQAVFTIGFSSENVTVFLFFLFLFSKDRNHDCVSAKHVTIAHSTHSAGGKDAYLKRLLARKHDVCVPMRRWKIFNWEIARSPVGNR